MRKTRTPKPSRTQEMAAAMLINAQQKGCATERDMLHAGFSPAEIRTLGPDAINLAHRTGGLPYAHDTTRAC
jgi:hypothetical protein